MKKKLLAGVLGAALMALFGIFSTDVSAQPASQTWSVAVYIRYSNDFIYDHTFATGVSTEELTSMLQYCASAHGWGSANPYHCYVIPE